MDVNDLEDGIKQGLLEIINREVDKFDNLAEVNVNEKYIKDLKENLFNGIMEDVIE